MESNFATVTNYKRFATLNHPIIQCYPLLLNLI